MSEHVTDWIAAYHDSELDAIRLSQVESHLLECPACRAELEALKALSTMLQMNPTMPGRTPPERFVAQVRLRVRPPVTSPAQPRQQAGWLLAPLIVLGLWAFLQAVLVLSHLIVVTLPLFDVPGTQTEWFPVLGTAQLLVLDLALTAGLATLLWGWLAGWWAVRSKQNRSAAETAG